MDTTNWSSTGFLSGAFGISTAGSGLGSGACRRQPIGDQSWLHIFGFLRYTNSAVSGFPSTRNGKLTSYHRNSHPNLHRLRLGNDLYIRTGNHSQVSNLSIDLTSAGLPNFREAFDEGGDANAAHIFLRSVHHIPIERGWLDLRNDFGHNFPHFWDEGEGIYDVRIEKHR